MIRQFTLTIMALLLSIASFAVSPITGPHTVCAGHSVTLMDSTTGGSWFSSNTAVATVGSSTGVVTGVAAGNCTISYYAGSMVTYTFTVNPTPYIVGPTTLTTSTPITLTGGPTGGVWSSGCPAIMTVSSGGVVTGVTAGACFITYTLTTGCMNSHPDTVTGGGTVLPISGSNHVCVGSTIYLTDSTPGGTWSSSNPAVASVGSTGVVTGISAGTCTITYTVGGSYVTKSITVNPLPASITGGTSVSVGGTLTLADGTSGGYWTSSNSSIATVGSATGIVTGVSAGTVTITYNLTTGCFVTHTVTVTGTSILPITGTMHTCVGNYSILHDSTSGGTWSSSNTAIATVGSTGAVVGVSAGTCTITYTVGGSYVTTSFTVYAAPATIGGGSSMSVGGTLTLTDATTGGVWSSSNPSVASVGSLTGIVTGVSAGTATITYMLTTGCFVTHTVTVSGTTILPITGTFSLCVGSTTTLHDSTSGGSWSSSNTAIATVGTSTGVVTGIATGTCTITYTVGGSHVTHGITVNPIPTTPTGPTTVAVGSSITLTDGTGGGTWSSGSTSIATVNATTGVVTGVTAGTVWIYYTLTTGCSNHISVTVTGGSGILPITGTFSLCAGSTTYLHDSTSGGSWSSSNTSIATINATSGLVTGVTAGTCTITYTVGGSYVTHSITVNAAPAAIGGGSTVTVGGTLTLTDATTGGTWSSSNTSVATVNPTSGVVTGVSSGTVTIYYTLPGGCSVAHTVTVGGGTSILPISGTNHVCVGSSTTLHDSTAGGHWSSSNTAIATVGSTTGIVVGVAAGTCTITYTVGASYVTMSFTVNALPAAITGPTTVAVGSTITLSDATPGGTWISGNTSIATVSSTGVVTGITGGTVNIYYSTPAGCGASHTVTVTGGTTLPITGTFTVCAGGTTTLHDSTSGGSWSSSNTSVATVNATTGVVTGVAAGTCTITYAAGGSIATHTLTVIAAPAAITGSSSTCVGNYIILSDATTGGVWSSSNTSVATVGTTGVVIGIAPGVVNIYYTLTTGCSVYKSVTVNAAPAAISGSSTACIGSTITLTDATSGGTWSSVYAAIATVGSASGIVTGVSAGTTTIIYTVGGCATSKSVTVSPAPAAITGSSSLCVGSSITLADATTGGTWSSGSTSIAAVTTGGLVTGGSAGVVNIYYSIGSCAVYHTVTVNPVPSAISGSSTVHTGGSPITLTDAVPGGSWFSGNPSLATVGASTGIVTGVSAGTVNIYYSIGGCAVYKTITVYSPAPPGFTNGVGQLSGLSNIKLFPNPTSGNLNIEWENEAYGNVTIVLTDVTGREVFRSIVDMTTDSGSSQLNVSNLIDGIYIISVRSESGSYNSRLMVQH